MPTMKAGPVKTVKVDPADLLTLEQDDLDALLDAAEAVLTSGRKPKSEPKIRCMFTLEEEAFLSAVGWTAPYADTRMEWAPKGASGNAAVDNRSCKLGAFYKVMAGEKYLHSGAVSVPRIASLLARSLVKKGANPADNCRSLSSLMKVLAQRTGRRIIQRGGMVSFAGVTGRPV